MLTEACGGKLKFITTQHLEDPRLDVVCSGQQIRGWGKGLSRKRPAIA